MKIKGVSRIERSHIIDILFRGGFTIEETRRFQEFRANRDAMTYLLNKRKLCLTDGRFVAQAGETLESEADYAEHYQALS